MSKKLRNEITQEIEELMEFDYEMAILFGELEEVVENRKALFEFCNKEEIINGVLLEDEFNQEIAGCHLKPYKEVIDRTRETINEITGISVEVLKGLPVSIDITNYLPASALGAYIRPFKNAKEVEANPEEVEPIVDLEKNIIALKYDPVVTNMTEYGISERIPVLLHEYAHFLNFSLMEGKEFDLPLEGIGEYAKTNAHESFAEAFREYIMTKGNVENATIIRTWEGADEPVDITARNKAVKGILEEYSNKLK